MMKKTIKMHGSCIMLIIALLISMMPQTVIASGGKGSADNPYIATTYEELRSLMANAPTDGTECYIKLAGDISSEDSQNDYSLTLINEKQKVVLDLAGHKITRKSVMTVDGSVIRAKKGTLTINDSVGTGGVYARGSFNEAVGLISTDGVYVDKGTIIINGGTFESDAVYGQGAYIETGYLYIKGGIFKGYHGLYISQGKETQIYGGIFEGKVGATIDGGTTSIYGGNFKTTEQDGNAIIVRVDITARFYNLSAYGSIEGNGTYADLWNYIPAGDVYVDGNKQSKTSTKKFSGNNIVIETKVTDEIDITIDAPFVGEEIDSKKTAYVPYDVNYEIYKENDELVVNWFKGDIFAHGTFEANTAYSVRIMVKVVGIVTPNIGAKVNGKDANLELRYEDKNTEERSYLVEYTFASAIDKDITKADVTIKEPVAGEEAKAGILYSTDKFSVSVGWQTSTAAENFGNFNFKTFEEGSTYFAYLYLTANDPYEFTENAIISVNGKEYQANWTDGPEYKKYVQVGPIEFSVKNTSVEKQEDDKTVLKTPKIKKIKRIIKNKIKVKWTKVSGVKGYKVQYSTQKSFSKKKTKTVKSKTSTVISKLKKGKKYYVRVRCYKKVSGKMYYSKWSKTKKIRIKK